MTNTLWHQVWDEVNDDANKNNCASNFRINGDKTTTSKSFECKTQITGKTDNSSRLDTEVVVPLKFSVAFGDLLIYLWLTGD